jgi:hypothetical protein
MCFRLSVLLLPPIDIEPEFCVNDIRRKCITHLFINNPIYISLMNRKCFFRTSISRSKQWSEMARQSKAIVVLPSYDLVIVIFLLFFNCDFISPF